MSLLDSVNLPGITAGALGVGVVGSFDPSIARLAGAGLLNLKSTATSNNAYNTTNTTPHWIDTGNNAAGNSKAGTDWRIRVSVDSQTLYNQTNNAGTDPDIFTPLIYTGGVVFPITPSLQVTHTAKYSSNNLTHSNYAMQFYEGSETGSVMINGEFPIQTIAEGQYLLAAIYFFRAATKMFWGGDDLAGTPPPMVFLDGYGDFYFPHVPCVVTNFMHTLPDNVDYIEVPTTSLDNKQIKGTTRLPLQSTLQVTLQPIYSRTSMTKFTLNDFAKGNMISGGPSGKGGFL